MKKSIIFFGLFVFLLTGCTKTDPVIVDDPTKDPVVTCEDDEELVNGVCEKIVIRDYEQELLDIYNSFTSDLQTSKIGSQSLDVIVTRTGDFFGAGKTYRLTYYIEFDLNQEVMYMTIASTIPNAVPFSSEIKNVEGQYIKTTMDGDTEIVDTVVFDESFEADFYNDYQIPFRITMDDSVLDVSNPVLNTYKLLVNLEYLNTNMNDFLSTYLEEFTNPTVSIEFYFNQLSNELEYHVLLINNDTTKLYEQLEFTYKVKILDELLYNQE